MVKVHRSARADEDLIEIWRHVAADSLAAADRLIDAIERRWRQLETHPESGSARDDILPGLRQIVAGRYLILHRIDAAGDIRIVRVLHGNRDVRREVGN
ncbi:MAG: plasmid stabilization protein [Fulvimarina sp.]|nr:plasmid stabilization protein [Fulvimarina sp.]